MTRFPSDLLETSVDPDTDIKDTLSSDIPPFEAADINPQSFKRTTSKECQSLKQNTNLGAFQVNQLGPNKYEAQEIETEHSVRTIECATDSARFREADLTLLHTDKREPLSTASGLLNQTHRSEDQLINLENVFDTKTFHVTRSTLETANSTEIPSSLDISKEEEDQSYESGNNTNRAEISFSEEFDSKVEAEMVRIYNPTSTTASGAQPEWQVMWLI